MESEMSNIPAANHRIGSIDLLRGGVIFLMIFFNTGVPGSPWWMQHFPKDQNGMTIVYVIFPAFLFIMGMSIPFSIGKQLEKGVGQLIVMKSIILRSAALILMGLLDVGLNQPNIATMGGSIPMWGALVFLSYFFVLHTTFYTSNAGKYLSIALRTTGIVFLLWYSIRFENVDGGWFKTGYWGILGVLGWSYFIVGSLYFLVRNNRDLQILAAFTLLAYYIFIKQVGYPNNHWLQSTASLWGGRPSIVMLGVTLGCLIREPMEHVFRFRWALLFAGSVGILAIFFEPLYGIGKVRSTPTWIFASICITVLAWIAVYWWVDVHRRKNAVTDAISCFGAVPLAIYILHPLLMNIMKASGLEGMFEYVGKLNFAVGMVRTLVLTLCVCWLAAFLNSKYKFTLKV
jgi:predicted acyltransferase